MKMKIKHNIKILFLLLVMCILGCQCANAKAKGVLPSAKPGVSFVPNQTCLMMLDGPCYYLRQGLNKWHKANRGMSFSEGDALRTGSFGYAVVAFSDKEMLLLKPNTALKLCGAGKKINKAEAELFKGEIMLCARNSAGIRITGQHGTLLLSHGEASLASNSEGETIKALAGTAYFNAQSSGAKIEIPESYTLDITKDNIEKPLSRFDPKSEYDSYKRFNKWLKAFYRVHEQQNLNVNYKITRAKINGKFLNDLVRQQNGCYCIESDDGKAVKQIHLQLKVEPYPSIHDRIELNLGKDLTYALREGHDGYFEVIFSLPAMPDFFIAIHSVDMNKRRNCFFRAGFTVQNTRSLKTEAKNFCSQLCSAVSRRDVNWLKKHISKDYKDWHGSTNFDFIKCIEDTFRGYQDLRLILHPFNYVFQKDKIIIHLNYRLSALTRSWAWRYNDNGADIYTLVLEDGRYKLYSKTSGLFFNRLKTAIDLKKGVVKGRIIDERTKMPISGVSVVLMGTNCKATTNAMGEYVIYNVKTGTYNIKFFKNGYGELTASKITVRPSGEQF